MTAGAADSGVGVYFGEGVCDGWAVIGGWPLFRSSQSLALLEDLTQRKLKVVCVDALPEQLVYVQKGLAVLLAQPVYDWGTVWASH